MKKPLLFGIILTACVVIVAFVFSLGFPGGMISYWKFDEVDGTTASDSADANDGTLVNGPVWTTGKVGGALSFDGFDDYVTMGDPVDGSLDFGSTTDFSVCFWLKPDVIGLQCIIRKGQLSGPNDGWHIRLQSDNTLRVEIGDGAYAGWIGKTVYNTVYNVGNWRHTCVVFDRDGEISFFIDGVKNSLTLNISGIGNIDTSDSLVLGAKQAGNFLDGSLDEVAIFNRALSAEEIQQHYQNGLNGLGYEVECIPPADDMVSWWPGDGDANDIIDGNHGTLENGATYAAGKVEQAFSFDGVDDYVQLPAFGSFTQFTVDAWIKRTGTTYTRETIVSYKEGETIWGPLNDGFVLSLNENGTSQKPRLWVDVDETWRYTEGLEAIPLNSFIHIAGSYDGNTLRLYVNGELVAFTLAPGSMTQSVQVSAIGSRATDHNVYPHFFPGIIDEVEIFNRALSSDEIQAIYIAGSAGKCKNEPPVAVCKDIEISIDTSCQASIAAEDVNGGSYDPDEGDTITLSVDNLGPFPLGEHYVNLTVTDESGESDTCQANVIVADTIVPDIEEVAEELQDIIDSNPGTDLEDMLEDTPGDLDKSMVELDKPDNQAAVGIIEGVVWKIHDAVDKGLSSAEAKELMDRLAGTAWQLAVNAICYAVNNGGDSGEINDAQKYLVEGDELRGSKAHKDAVNKYKDALAKAEGAVS